QIAHKIVEARQAQKPKPRSRVPGAPIENSCAKGFAKSALRESGKSSQGAQSVGSGFGTCHIRSMSVTNARRMAPGSPILRT
ncbi:MAG: hypothetical protein ACXVAM_18855, partial [Vulcanimicrobiaceae bacterium]